MTRPSARDNASEFCERILKAGGEVCVTFTVRDLHPDYAMKPGEVITLGFGGRFGTTTATHDALVCPARVGPYERRYYVRVPWGCVRKVLCLASGESMSCCGLRLVGAI